MMHALTTAIDRLRADATSGASELLPRAIEILRATRDLPREAALDLARAVGRAQPSMASIWNAALAALADRRDPGALDRFDQRRRRAAAALSRSMADQLLTSARGAHHVVTLSFSGSVLAGLRAAAQRTRLVVSCAEGRPGLEGRRLAEALSEAGIPVEFYTDAAIGEALGRHREAETTVIVGADAVTPNWFLNKCGTGMLAAAAARVGVPVYAVAARDKFMDDRAAHLLQIVDHDGRAVWAEAPAGVVVSDAWFERVSADLAGGVITDAGSLSPAMLAEACRAASAEVDGDDVEALLKGREP